MSNIANNPWIEKKKQLLENTAVIRLEQSSFNPLTGYFDGPPIEILDRRPEKLLAAVLKTQHKYIARRQREGMLIAGFDYESCAKRVATGTIVKELIGLQPMREKEGKVYYFQYKTRKTDDGDQISLEIMSDSIVANTKKYKTSLSKDTIRNLESQYKNRDVGHEFEDIVASSLVQELDSRYANIILETGHKYPDLDMKDLLSPPDDGLPYFISDRFVQLVIKINQVANEIARKTRRGAGNWLLCSPMVVSILQVSKHTVFAPALHGSFKGPNNSMLVGILNGTMKVYSYLWSQAYDKKYAQDPILIGYKGGSGEVDAGLFYCPHTMITHSRKKKHAKNDVLLPFATTEACFAAPNAADYYGSFNVTNLTFA